MGNGRKIAIGTLAAAAVLAAWHPTPGIRVLTHDIGDPHPHQMQVAVDLGLVGVSFLYTWTQQRLS